MKNIFIIIFVSLLFTCKKVVSQTETTWNTVVTPAIFFGTLKKMEVQKMEISKLNISNTHHNSSIKKINVIDQINMLKVQCPIQVKKKSSLILNGERLDETIVSLDWKRKYGYDDRLYLVQRSVNDTDHFETVGTVWANAQFRSREEYDHDDANDHAGISYYRLKLTDIQNQFIYSNIIEVKGYAREKMRVFPNPAKSDTRLYLDTDIEGPSTLQILDVNGRMLKQEHFFLFAGINTRTINTDKLVNGVYIIKIIKADKSVVAGRLNKIN